VTVLYWLVVPLVATAIAAVWVAFTHRARPRAETQDSMAEHQRFRQAMERQRLAEPVQESADREPRGRADDTDLSA
jgi:hypothetical protein